jgi:hypothetical protein
MTDRPSPNDRRRWWEVAPAWYHHFMKLNPTKFAAVIFPRSK